LCNKLHYMSYSGDYTGEKTVDTSHCRWQW
jgi:hypothetical protein